MIKRFTMSWPTILVMGLTFMAVTLSLAQNDDQAQLEVLETNIEFTPSPTAAEPIIKPQEDLPQIHFEKTTTEGASPQVQGTLREQQIIELNKTMKQMIEQYELLERQREELDTELRFIRGQRQIEQNRLNTINDEMRRVREQTEQLLNLNQQYSRQIMDARLRLGEQEKEYQLRIKELEDRLEKIEPSEELAMAAGQSLVPSPPGQRTDLVSMIDQIAKEGERLKQDTAKVHYNMGNIFFHKGDYQKAAEEYKKALKLMPRDAAAHFNLAFVSGEYLHDHTTAVKHYREYLILNPEAVDALLVKEKLLHAELAVDVTIDSPLDKPYRP